MCEQFSPSLITTSHHKSINYDSSFIPWDLNFKTDTRLWCCCHEGESRFTAHIRTRITQSAYDFMFFFFFYGRPTLLSLIAARSVQQHFYERLPPINLPLIPHMKVMSLLMVTEVWSVSLIEIALHLGGNKHYSFMFPKAECGFWIRRARVIDSRIHQMWWFVECGLRLEPFHILLHFFVFYIERFCLTLQSWRFVIIHKF